MISETTLDKLEYQKVLNYISNYSITESGKDQLKNLTPYQSKNIAEKNGHFVSEAKEILINHEFVPIDFLPNLKDSLYKSRIDGSVLSKKNIQYILQLAIISRKIFNFLNSNASETELLIEFKGNLFSDKVFESHIEKVFDNAGEIKDSASPKLAEIRKDIRKQNNILQNVIERILKGLKNSYLVQEEYVTQRDGRLVLPIKAEHKRHIKGFIHSESNTGQTVYIEPEETLELNNDILSLSFAEKREIEKILKQLTILVGNNSNELLNTLNVITELDTIFAKAKYSLEIIGAYPTFSDKNRINLIDARHPILLKKIKRENTIPLNFKYTDNNVTLITGPNAGGKTVVLKTIGLLSALIQSGIHVPIHPDSETIFFENIVLDIGDQQSIEEDLSTFSSHLSNIKEILSQANDKTLILIDEIGTGTDPSEGTALASSFLIKMAEEKSVVVATTHHGNLKIIASELPHFQNASMEYDLEKLAPTYKFRQGIPGSSYAFEVARKIGLEEEILKTAENYLDSDKHKVENFIIDLENKSLVLNNKLKEIEIENARLKGLTNLYEQENKKLKDQKSAILSKTKDEAESFLKNVNKEFENTIRKIKESNAEKSIIKEEKEKIEKIKKSISSQYPSKNIIEEKIGKRDFTVGDFVQIKDSLTSGDIISIDTDRKIATVSSGNFKIKVKIANLVHSMKEKKKETVVSNISITSVDSTTLDIRGRKPEEVEFEIVKFLDDAYLSNLKTVEIVHGKGTGALRETVHTILKSHEMVQSFDFASVELGGAGATVIHLKK